MKILIVDDEFEKARRICECLEAIPLLDISHVTTATAARKELRRSRVDVLLIDINLPAGLNDAPAPRGGLELFDLLCLDVEVQLPADILFLTQLDELVAEARKSAEERGASLFQYRTDDDDWKVVLRGRIQFALERLKRDPMSVRIDVAVITALQKPEMSAVLELPYSWVTRQFRGEPTTYQLGSTTAGDGATISVVAACAQRKGMPSSAALAARVALQFQPKILMMVGICAGIANKVGLGDIVIANPTWDYGSGKRALDLKDSPVFLAAPYQMPLEANLAELARSHAQNLNTIAAIRAGWDKKVPAGTLSAHLGPMASGASVLADDQSARDVLLQHRELIAIEMEAYAVMAATEYCSQPRPRSVAIKSVCDFADSSKNDDWQAYASYTSVAFADALIRDPLLFDRH
jgi:nucleoside phosphorylase